MDYPLDISDPAIQDAMKSLDITANDLLLHEVSFFEGTEKIQKLRYDHHTKRVQKLIRQIKQMIKAEKSMKNKKFNLSFETERMETQESSVAKVKAKVRNNLSLQIKLENQRRSKLSSSMQKLLRKDAVVEKLKNKSERNRISQSLKRDAIELRLSSLLREQRQKNQQLNDRLTRVSSRVGSYTPSSRKQGSISRMTDNEASFERLQGLTEKIDRSSLLHETLLRQTSLKMADHNSKVHSTLRTQKSIREINQASKLVNMIEKIDNFDSRKIKQKRMHEMISSRKQQKLSEKLNKFNTNFNGQLEKSASKVRKLESKQAIEKNILLCQLQEFHKEKEYKCVKQKLRDEDAKENLKRIKKHDTKKRDELLERHLEERKKFLQMKEYREKANERIRYEAAQAKHEIIKAKLLHIIINKAEDPTQVERIIDQKFLV